MRRAAIASFLLVLSPNVLAWSALGHRMVGELAERHLKPATAREVHALLARDSEPTLAGVAGWADALRSRDPQRFNATSRWHYVDTAPEPCRYEAARDCPDGNCIVAAIDRQKAILADRSRPTAERSDALRFLVHLVGDAQQPMHSGNRNDKGGNRFQVSLRTDLAPEAYARNRYANGVMGTNLHSVWDYYVLASAGLGANAYGARLDAQPWPPAQGEADSSPAAWAEESCRLIDSSRLYPRQHALDRPYLDANRTLAEQRIRVAAYRLTRTLDDIFAPGRR